MEDIYPWLGGLVDGDGCFTISITISKTKNKSILITPQVRIALKGNDSDIIYYIQKNTNFGKVYFSNKDKPNSICSWQTTNITDAIGVTKMLIPHLKLKKDKAIKFLAICKYWRNTTKNKKGISNKIRRRTKEQMLKIIKEAIELNYDRQTIRYRNKKGLGYWTKVINTLYPN